VGVEIFIGFTFSSGREDMFTYVEVGLIESDNESRNSNLTENSITRTQLITVIRSRHATKGVDLGNAT
jgi:hypothetical protein